MPQAAQLANSIIVFDEAQTIPLRLLRPCLAALGELARNYGCTIVLCTATQPAVASPQFKGGLELGPEREIAPDPAGLHDALRRATIKVASERMSDGDLVAALGGVDHGFVIVNSRRHALDLFRAARSRRTKVSYDPTGCRSRCYDPCRATVSSQNALILGRDGLGTSCLS